MSLKFHCLPNVNAFINPSGNQTTDSSLADDQVIGDQVGLRNVSHILILLSVLYLLTRYWCGCILNIAMLTVLQYLYLPYHRHQAIAGQPDRKD